MADTVSLNIGITRAWWMPAAIGVLGMWSRCGLPMSERMLWLLIGGGFKFKVFESLGAIQPGGCAPPVYVELPARPERTDMILEGPA